MKSFALNFIQNSDNTSISKKSFGSNRKDSYNSSFEKIFASNKRAYERPQKQISRKDYNDKKYRTNNETQQKYKDTDKNIENYRLNRGSENLRNQATKAKEDTAITETQQNVKDDKINEEVDSELKQLKESIINLISNLSNLEESDSSKSMNIAEQTENLKGILSNLQSNIENLDITQLKNLLQNLRNLTKDLINNKDFAGLEVSNNKELTSLINEIANIVKEHGKLDKISQDATKNNFEDIIMSSKNKYHQQKEIAKNNLSKGSQDNSDKSFNSTVDSTILENNNNINKDNNTGKVMFQQYLNNQGSAKVTTEVQGQLNTNATRFYNVDKDNLLQQIVNKVKVDVKNNNSQIKINLKPNILGEMSIKLSMDEGVITAKAIVQDYQVKQLVESNLSQLKDNLEKQGIDITNFEVSVGQDSNFQGHQQRNWNNKNRRKIGKINNDSTQYNQYLENVDELTESAINDDMLGSENRINLKA